MHFVRKLCGDFAAILRRFLQNQQQFSSNLVKFNLISFTESKSKTPRKSLTNRSLVRVPGRTRTVDIQNHNLTL